MNLEELKLTLGDTLQLEFLGATNERVTCKLIGVSQGKSLIINTPKIRGQVMSIRAGTGINVRVFTNNTVCGFTSSVLKASVQPYAYLHLHFPHEIKVIDIRAATRVSISLAVIVKKIGEGQFTQKIRGELTDISTSGARLLADSQIASVGQFLLLTTKIGVHSILRSIGIKALVRSRIDHNGQDKNLVLYGLEFQEMSEEEQIILYGFVYQQIVGLNNRN